MGPSGTRMSLERARKHMGRSGLPGDAVTKVLYEGLPPAQAVRALMERDPKAEGASTSS